MFFGDVEDIIHDCCGSCPKPSDPEEEEVWERESKVYISGEVTFIKDDPGRQAIGSFNPITETDWTGTYNLTHLYHDYCSDRLTIGIRNGLRRQYCSTIPGYCR